MIYLSNFDTEFKGRKFMDTSNHVSPTVFVCVGYGDNQGNPYLVGIKDTGNGKVVPRTVLIKNVEFVP